MALRGTLTLVQIWADLSALPLYNFQNHFNPSFTDEFDITYLYKPFRRGSISTESASSTDAQVTLEFFASAENVTLIDTALNGDYAFGIGELVWDSAANINAPTTTTLISYVLGTAVKADITHTTITLTIGTREDSVSGDFPAKKISKALLGPLNLGS
jgi:hypothetical protein